MAERKPLDELTEAELWLISDALSVYQSRWRGVEDDRFAQAIETDRKVLAAIRRLDGEPQK